ncbi:MAG TPA: tripartite tricarboxylate transporter substrate binding protein [Acetobacteraceae bacterium]|nr:tripartite tricarboxylate transporter substrate binding protein [Acetobacteraceae bacterium]
MMLTRRSVAAMGAVLPLAARAQEWSPDRALRIIVPYAPGGANDILARLLAQRFTERLGQAVVVENRPGAQAMLGTQFVAQARPDGLTLLVAASGPITVSPAVNRATPYRPLHDLTPVSMIASFPLLLIVRADSPHRTVAELVAWARANPGRANYASSAASFQLATELFKQRTETAFQHVAYRGSADSTNAVASGEVTMALVDAGPATPALEAGRVRALATTAPQRLPSLPDVPTMAEAGVPGIEVLLWSALLAPAGTPAPVVARLAAETARAVREPDVAQRITAYRMTAAADGPEALRTTIARELLLWAEVARAGNLRFEE